jgi:hypothetical protein
MDSLAKTQPLAFWRIGMHLIRRSNVFYTMALNHVFPLVFFFPEKKRAKNKNFALQILISYLLHMD